MTDPDERPEEPQTRGSLIAFLIGEAFNRVETLNRDATHRRYLECKLCGGTDQLREHYKPSIDAVQHGGACSLATNLAWLRRLSGEPSGDTPSVPGTSRQ